MLPGSSHGVNPSPALPVADPGAAPEDPAGVRPERGGGGGQRSAVRGWPTGRPWVGGSSWAGEAPHHSWVGLKQGVGGADLRSVRSGWGLAASWRPRPFPEPSGRPSPVREGSESIVPGAETEAQSRGGCMRLSRQLGHRWAVPQGHAHHPASVAHPAPESEGLERPGEGKCGAAACPEWALSGVGWAGCQVEDRSPP